MKKMKILSIILSLAIIFSAFVGCGSSSTSNTSNNNNTQNNSNNNGPSIVHVGIPADPAELAPFSGLSPGRIAVNRTLYETLIDREGFGGKMVGVIMKDYKKISDNTYQVSIYDYIYDTAGNHLTAKDVAWCYNTAKEMGNLPKLKDIVSVKAINDYTVEFVFNSLKAGDLETLWSECPIVTQAAYEASKDKMATTPVGTTAYKLKSFTPSSSIVFEKTDKYWQKDISKITTLSRANIDIIDFQIIPEASQMAIALETGKIDISTRVAENDLPRFEQGGSSSKDFIVYKLQKNQSDYLVFNCSENNVFANQALRQAVAYAIDKEGIINGVYKGKALICKTFGNSKYADYNKKWENEEYFDYNLEKAKQLFSQSGYKPGQLNVRIMTGSLENLKKEAQMIQGYLSEIGINSNIVSYESSLFNTYKYDPKQYDLMIDQYASTDYLVNIWKLMFDNTQYKNGKTMNFVKDDKLQQLLTTARSINGHTQENVDAFHYYLKDKAYAIALVNAFDNIVHRNTVTKIVTDARGFVIPGACEYKGR